MYVLTLVITGSIMQGTVVKGCHEVYFLPLLLPATDAALVDSDTTKLGMIQSCGCLHRPAQHVRTYRAGACMPVYMRVYVHACVRM